MEISRIPRIGTIQCDCIARQSLLREKYWSLFVSGQSFYARVGSIAHKGAIQRRRMASVVGRNPTTKSQEADAERIRQYRPEVDIERTSTSPSPCILGRRAADLVESAVRMFSEVKRAGSSFY